MKHVSNAFRCTQLCLIYDCARTYDEADRMVIFGSNQVYIFSPAPRQDNNNGHKNGCGYVYASFVYSFTSLYEHSSN